jgi:hypothetical protein
MIPPLPIINKAQELGVAAQAAYEGPPGYEGIVSLDTPGVAHLLPGETEEEKQARLEELTRVRWSGDSERIGLALMKAFDADEVVQDANGYFYVETPHGRIYAEQPGLDTEDVLRAGTKTAGYMMAGGRTIPATAAREGLVGGMYEAQTGSGPWDIAAAAATDAALGVVGGGVARGISKFWDAVTGGKGKKIIQDFERNFGVKVQDEDAFFRQMGDNPDFTNITPEAAEVIARGDMPLDRGQITNRADDITEVQRIESEGGLDALRDRQELRIESGKPVTSRGEAAADLVEDINVQAAPGRARASQLYEEVEQGALEGRRAYLNSPAFNELPGRVREAIPDTVIRDIDNYPGLKKALREIDELTDDAIRVGQMGGIDARYVRQKIRNIDNQISKREGGTEEFRHLSATRRVLNDWYHDTIERAMLHGDVEMVDLLKEASTLYADWAKRFKDVRGQEDVMKWVNAALDGHMEPIEIARGLVGQTAAFKPMALRSVKFLRDSLGPESEAYKAIGRYALNLITEGPQGKQIGPQGLMRNLETVFSEKGGNREMFQVLLGADELANLENLYKDLRVMFPQGLKRAAARRDSGTAQRLVNMMRLSGGGIEAEMLGMLLDQITKGRGPSARQILKASRPDQLPPQTGDISAALGGATPSVFHETYGEQ